jgi:CubicO group peptidase (beta-lactamase class C family)
MKRNVLFQSRLAFLPVLAAGMVQGADLATVFLAEHWLACQPQEVGLSRAKLDALRDLVGGRGCVVRHGRMAYTWGDQQRSADVASAMKPVLSALLLIAVQEKKIGSVDDKVARFEPRLKDINGGKDARITWRHLASQTSGYGLVEQPGKALHLVVSWNDARVEDHDASPGNAQSRCNQAARLIREAVLDAGATRTSRTRVST